MKKLIAAAILTLGAGTAQAQDSMTVSTLTAQGKVLLASHLIEQIEVVTMILGTVEGGPEFICRTRFRGGTGYDECRKLQ